MKITHDTAVRKIKSTHTQNKMNGIAAHFVYLSSGWGLKYFTSSVIRNLTYRFQQEIHKIGYAPALGQKIDFDLNGITRFGYVTEAVVETIGDIYAGLVAIGSMNREDAENYEEIIADNFINDIKDNIYWQTGIILRDTHSDNIGVNKDGDMLLIDFSHCILTEINDGYNYIFPSTPPIDADITYYNIFEAHLSMAKAKAMQDKVQTMTI